MKVCISCSSNGKYALTDSRFGRCAYFAFYDTENKDFSFIENDSTNHPQGAGIAAVQKIVDAYAEVVITGSLGPNAMKFLQASNIKAYKIEEGNVLQQIKLFEEGKLKPIEEAGSGKAGMENRMGKGW
ncbi:MAG: NifB/NifX family molybdenum-iron cluster-binding protein [Thermotaleaceae bacterium]